MLDTWLDDPEAADPADDTERVQRFTVTGDNAPGTDNTWSYDTGSQFKSVRDASTDVAFIDRAIDVNPTTGDLFLTMDDNQDEPTATGIIQVTEGGTEVKRWGSRGTGVCQFSEAGDPVDLKLDSSGNIFAVDKSIVGSAVERVLSFGDGGTGCGFDPKPPNASFNFAPFSPAKNQTVNFDGSASTDPDGTIGNANFKWDLDGNGSFETDTGHDPHATKAYSTAGSVSVKLRVTDEQALTSDFSQTVNVGHNPVAAFSVRSESGQDRRDGQLRRFRFER